ncbi:hypothetical protein KBC59_01980 [Patescibacteria group bacterium]|jgi:hypothetical protein|nr:hypothetical protein [Patescibacteria group bacterium]
MKNIQKIEYKQLNARQKENFNFLKASAILADYGFNTIRLSDDWQGADFIASHIDGKTFYKVQLKGRFSVDKKYIGKNIWICFRNKEIWYLYPHDEIMRRWSRHSKYRNTLSWKKSGGVNNPNPTKEDLVMLKEYIL